nr:hypothetical protein [Tanacetum cinerariifolium]
MILTPRQPILYCQPYWYHPNGPLHMLTTKKRVGSLPTHRLAERHSVDYSSLDHFTFDDSLRDLPSDSSSETSSDSSLDAISDPSSGHSSLDHSLPAQPLGMRSSHQLCLLVPSIPYLSTAITERSSHSLSVGSSRKRSQFPTTYVPVSLPIAGALSYVRACLLPPHKRIGSPKSTTNLEVSSDKISESFVSIETGLGVDVEVEGSDEPYSGPDIDPEEVKTSARGTIKVRNDRVTHLVVSDDIPEPTQEGAIEVTYETLGDLVQRFHDHTMEIPVHRVQVIKGIQRDQGHMIVATSQQGVVMSKRTSSSLGGCLFSAAEAGSQRRECLFGCRDSNARLIKGLGVAEVDVRLASGVLLGCLVVTVEVVMGGNSPAFILGKGVTVEKTRWRLNITVPRMVPMIVQYLAQSGFDGDRRESLDGVESVGFDLVKCYLYTSFIKGHTAKGIELCVAHSHTSNHHKDDFTPLETIQKFLGVIGSIPFDLGRDAFEPNQRVRHHMYSPDHTPPTIWVLITSTPFTI